MNTLPISFTFTSEQQAQAAVDALAISFGYSEGDKLEFVKAQIATMLKERIIYVFQQQATEAAKSNAAKSLEGVAVE